MTENISIFNSQTHLFDARRRKNAIVLGQTKVSACAKRRTTNCMQNNQQKHCHTKTIKTTGENKGQIAPIAKAPKSTSQRHNRSVERRTATTTTEKKERDEWR